MMKDKIKAFEEYRTESIIYRTFKHDVSEELLVWHRDHKDRYVYVSNGTGWKIQFDDKLPIDLVPGDSVTITKNSYHRIIKGADDLSLIIIEDV